MTVMSPLAKSLEHLLSQFWSCDLYITKYYALLVMDSCIRVSWIWCSSNKKSMTDWNDLNIIQAWLLNRCFIYRDPKSYSQKMIKVDDEMICKTDLWGSSARTAAITDNFVVREYIKNIWPAKICSSSTSGPCCTYINSIWWFAVTMEGN